MTAPEVKKQPAMSKRKAAIATAAAIALATPFVAKWEGLWTTAKIDHIGTGQPVTVCYGATRADIPDLKVGQKFTAQECLAMLAKSLPKYSSAVDGCVKRPIPTSVRAALYSAAYNAGPGAVCHSPMVAKANAGDFDGACASLKSWYIRARGVVVRGLINRRADEARLCASGINAPEPVETKPLWQRFAQYVAFWRQS